METIFEKLVDEPKPTPEMVEFFNKRTQAHISRVHDAMAKVIRLAPHLPEKLREAILERAKHHDESKYAAPEYEPYVWLTWMYHCKETGEDFKYPEGMKDRIDKATRHHVLSNRHHPEYFAGEAPINPRDRDTATKAIDASGMSRTDVVEMVCDWIAMSQEKGNKAREWYEKNSGKRWIFHDEQKEFIEHLLNILE